MTSVGSFDAGRADTYAEVIETNMLVSDLLARPLRFSGAAV
jgi:hypothetical protein